MIVHGQQSFGGLALSDSVEGQKALAVELYDRFHAMKTYGKEPESLESIVRIFKKDLAKYPIEKVLLAISTHASRCDEFPTVADIVGIIKRNGKQPLSKEIYISISKKEFGERTWQEKRYIADYEEQERGEQWDLVADEEKKQITIYENEMLRKKLKEAEAENRRAWDEVSYLRAKYSELKRETIQVEPEDKILKTIEYLRNIGASPNEIEAFKMDSLAHA